MVFQTHARYFGMIFISLIGAFFVFQSKQFDLYSEPIGKITHVKTIEQQLILDEHQNKDTMTTQRLSVVLLNGEYQNKTLSIVNTYSQSQINDQRYNKGELVFIHISPISKNQSLEGSIIELKRDSWLIVLLTVFLIVLIGIGGKSGGFSFIGFTLNGLILTGLLMGYREVNSSLLLWLFALATPILVTISLSLANGWNKKTKTAVIATLIGTATTCLIGISVIELLSHKGLHYEEMELITRPPHVIFLSSLLIGCLGAVMDVAMTLTSSLFEIKQKNPTITPSKFKESGLAIGQDIMGPMTNIMFFSYLSGTIPLILIFLRNNMSLTYSFSIVLSLEFARALVGSIGIVLSVPITLYTAAHILLKKEAIHDR